MDQQQFEMFVTLNSSGQKDAAKAALMDFIASFETDEERSHWVHEFLERGGYGSRIRHELYSQLVFPVLLAGYQRQDMWSLYWLAGTAQNLYANRDLHAQVGYVSEIYLLREVYEGEPTPAVCQSLLMALIHWFNYCQHEWPAGILYGANGADIAECEEILQDLALARVLDTGAQSAYLDEFASRVDEYIRRLKSRDSI